LGPAEVDRPQCPVHPHDGVGAAARDLADARLDERSRERRRADQDLLARLDVERALDEEPRVGVDPWIAHESQAPSRCTTSPSQWIWPPPRSSLTMSQCTALSFRPPSFGKPAPMAKWTVPSIFSSKSVLRM